MSTVLLSVNQLSKSYGGRRAVDGVSFQVKHGQTVGLIGPNGAGKSSTVSMICGLLRSDGGSVELEGQAMAQGQNGAKLKIGLVPQDLALYEDLSAIENLKLFGALYGLKGALLKERCAQALDMVRLADRAADKPSTFSGGMKRRAAARTQAADPGRAHRRRRSAKPQRHLRHAGSAQGQGHGADLHQPLHGRSGAVG
jgi:ABC-2 type transport system ATP-binding protein